MTQMGLFRMRIVTHKQNKLNVYPPHRLRNKCFLQGNEWEERESCGRGFNPGSMIALPWDNQTLPTLNLNQVPLMACWQKQFFFLTPAWAATLSSLRMAKLYPEQCKKNSVDFEGPLNLLREYAM